MLKSDQYGIERHEYLDRKTSDFMLKSDQYGIESCSAFSKVLNDGR